MRRFALALTATALAAVAVSACSSSGNGGKPVNLHKTTAVQSACKQAPVKGGNLVYARQNETEGLNPLDATNGNGDIFADELIYDPLVRSDPTGGDKLVPGLATSWDVSSDGLTYTFHLRQGVQFSNGQPLTAADVKFSLDRFGNPKINTLLSNVAVGYKSSEVINSSTVAVHLSEPVAAFLYNISIFPAFIVPKNLVQSEGAAFFKHPVGTGPFELSQFVAGSHITFKRNPHYWEAGKPYLNSVRFDFATDSGSRLLELENGQAQIADGVLFSQINSVEQRKGLVVQPADVPLFVGLWLNHQRAPFKDLKVRQAMQYALNKQLINKSIFRGTGTIPNSVLMALQGDAPSSQVKPYPYDLAKAKQLMAASGFPKGFSTTLQYPAGYDYYRQLGLLMQSEYAQIGIKIKLVEEQAADETTNWSSSKYDMIFPFAQFTSDVVVPDEYAQFLAGDPSLGLQGFFSNWTDPAITKMVDAFTSDTNASTRATEWPKIQQALMTQTPVINVMDLPFVNAHASDVCGTAVNALGVDHLEDTWISG
jgi:peptide/nickel transport system substrate-binding protein